MRKRRKGYDEFVVRRIEVSYHMKVICICIYIERGVVVNSLNGLISI